MCLATTACVSPVRTQGSVAAHGKPDPEIGLRGRHAIRFNAGVLDWSVDHDSSSGNVTTEAGSSGFVGSVAYEYFIREDLAVGIGVGVLDSKNSTSVGVVA